VVLRSVVGPYGPVVRWPGGAVATWRRGDVAAVTAVTAVTASAVIVAGLKLWQDWAYPEKVGAIGAVGSALPSHGRGHRFESGIAHHENHPPPPDVGSRIRVPRLALRCPLLALLCPLLTLLCLRLALRCVPAAGGHLRKTGMFRRLWSE
jgi:hypothetical protein